MFYMEIEWYTAPALEHSFGKSPPTIRKFQPRYLNPRAPQRVE